MPSSIFPPPGQIRKVTSCFIPSGGAGLIEQGESHVVLSTGLALLLNCRTPQSYCTAPGQSCWHHYWVHLDGAGVAAMEPLLLPGKKLTPVQLTGVKMQELFETLFRADGAQHRGQHGDHGAGAA